MATAKKLAVAMVDLTTPDCKATFLNQQKTTYTNEHAYQGICLKQVKPFLT